MCIWRQIVARLKHFDHMLHSCILYDVQCSCIYAQRLTLLHDPNLQQGGCLSAVGRMTGCFCLVLLIHTIRVMLSLNFQLLTFSASSHNLSRQNRDASKTQLFPPTPSKWPGQHCVPILYARPNARFCVPFVFVRWVYLSDARVIMSFYHVIFIMAWNGLKSVERMQNLWM